MNKRVFFTKASACGNDFLIIEASELSGDLRNLTRRLCDRHNGVGADGVEWLFPDAEADVMAKLVNSDGSEAEISGNGTRCVAAELCSRSRKNDVTIRTGAGLKACHLLRSHDASFEFETDIGKPVLGSQLSVPLEKTQVAGTHVSMGNPHFVVIAEQFPSDWQTQAALIQAQPQFPHGINVEYLVVRGPNEIEVRLFERGAGETQSSGTGSCASAVAAISSGRVKSPVTVVAPGGAQIVRWENQVHLQGPATIICRGEFFV